MAAEAKNVTLTLPLGLWWGIRCCACSILVNVACLRALGVDGSAAHAGSRSGRAARCGGPAGARSRRLQSPFRRSDSSAIECSPYRGSITRWPTMACSSARWPGSTHGRACPSFDRAAGAFAMLLALSPGATNTFSTTSSYVLCLQRAAGPRALHHSRSRPARGHRASRAFPRAAAPLLDRSLHAGLVGRRDRDVRRLSGRRNSAGSRFCSAPCRSTLWTRS